MNPLRVFIGYDSREPIALHVLSHSILRRATRPVSITPLALNHLADWLYTRERTPKESTEFSFTRFLVPYLSGYEGVSIFMDCDMLCLTDLAVLPDMVVKDGDYRGRALDHFSVLVCKHDYTPRSATKFLGQAQMPYRRKNWSSLIVFNNADCRALAPEYVNAASGADLHQFEWLRCRACDAGTCINWRPNHNGDLAIGSLPLEFNYLVGEANQSLMPPKIVHYTNGGPWFSEYAHCDYSKEWFAERDHMEAGCRSTV